MRRMRDCAESDDMGTSCIAHCDRKAGGDANGCIGRTAVIGALSEATLSEVARGCFAIVDCSDIIECMASITVPKSRRRARNAS